MRKIISHLPQKPGKGQEASANQLQFNRFGKSERIRLEPISQIKTMTLTTLTALTFGAALFGSSLATRAATAYFETPSFRGSAATQTGFWDTFTSAYLGATSRSLPSGAFGLANATITQVADPGAFLTGTANIYDFAANTGFTLTYYAGSGPVSLAGFRTVLADLEGGDTLRWSWDLSVLGEINSFNISFGKARSMWAVFD